MNTAKERWNRIRPLSVPLILFIGSLAFTTRWLHTNLGSSWRIPVTLLPIALGLWLAFQIIRIYQAFDELERKILLDGMPFSFVLTVIATLSLGILNMAGIEPINPIFIALFMVLMWLVGKLLVRNRYQ